MVLRHRLLILVFVVVNVLVAREWFLDTVAPTAMTDLAISQMAADDEAAVALRHAVRGQSWLLSGWTLASVALLTAGWLFRHELRLLCCVDAGLAAPQQSAGTAADQADSTE